MTTWDAATGHPAAHRHRAAAGRQPGAAWGTTAIPDSTRGVVIDADGVAVVRDFAASKDLVRLTGHFARISAVAVSPDGKRIATASADGLIRVWDVEAFRPMVESLGHTAAVRGVEVSPDGRLALTTGADRTVRLWDVATGQRSPHVRGVGRSTATFTPDGAAVRVPLGDRVAVRDLVTGLEVVSAVRAAGGPVGGGGVAAAAGAGRAPRCRRTAARWRSEAAPERSTCTRRRRGRCGGGWPGRAGRAATWRSPRTGRGC